MIIWHFSTAASISTCYADTHFYMSSDRSCHYVHTRRVPLWKWGEIEKSTDVFLRYTGFTHTLTFCFINLEYPCTSMTLSVVTGDCPKRPVHGDWWLSQKTWHFHRATVEQSRVWYFGGWGGEWARFLGWIKASRWCCQFAFHQFVVSLIAVARSSHAWQKCVFYMCRGHYVRQNAWNIRVMILQWQKRKSVWYDCESWYGFVGAIQESF